MVLLAIAAPLVSTAGLSSGLLPRQCSTPLWYLLLLAPFWEETFFRGALQRRMMRLNWGGYRFAGLTAATWFTGTLFVLVHLPFQGVKGILIVIPALALGRLFEEYDEIIPCILLHGWFNLCWLAATYLVPLSGYA